MKQGLEISFALLLAVFLFLLAHSNVYVYQEMQKNFLRRDSSKSHL